MTKIYTYSEDYLSRLYEKGENPFGSSFWFTYLLQTLSYLCLIVYVLLFR
jgi:hypothetical protein